MANASSFDHLGFNVGDFAKSRAFYTKALAPLGLKAVIGGDNYVGFGQERPEFWLGTYEEKPEKPGRIHVAFRPPNRAAVRAFYEAALKAGGKDNGPPGLRPDYHPNYYGAFVIDHDGHNVEAVCHDPEK